MPDRKLTVEIIEEQPLPIAAVLVEARLQQSFATYSPSVLTNAIVEILTTDDATMQALNRTHRNVDATTDVLSLPTAIDSDRGVVVPSAQDAPTHLGTIVISLQQAERQTGRFGDTLEAEILGLAEHGLRHLLGHDHDNQGTWTSTAAAS